MSSFSIEHMKLALAYHMVREIIGADEEVTTSERDYLSATFPASKLRAAAMTDTNGRTTDLYDRCLGQALISLPETLSVDERLGILEQVFHASLADEDFVRQEAAVLLKAAKLLSIGANQLDTFLGQLDAVGTVDLPAPETP